MTTADLNLDDNEVLDDHGKLLRDTDDDVKSDAEPERSSTPPPKDPAKNLAKDLVDKKFTGEHKKFDLESDDEGDDGDDTVDVKSAKATPLRNKSLEDKCAILTQKLNDLDKILESEGIEDVLLSGDSVSEKIKQAYLLYLLGQKKSKEADAKQQQGLPKLSGLQALALPRPEDVPLGITPEEWVQLEHQRKMLIRRIADQPELAQYFDWCNKLFSGTAPDVKLTLQFLA